MWEHAQHLPSLRAPCNRQAHGQATHIVVDNSDAGDSTDGPGAASHPCSGAGGAGHPRPGRRGHPRSESQHRQPSMGWCIRAAGRRGRSG